MKVTIPVQVLIRDVGECPLCGFDSLRKVTGCHLTPQGVTTVFEQLSCGRCVSDLRESL